MSNNIYLDNDKPNKYTRYTIFTALLLILSLAISCSKAPALTNPTEIFPTPTKETEIPAIEPIITLDRSPCLGTCPVYTITINGEGTVLYDGKSMVAQQGLVTYSIPIENIQTLVNEFEKIDYFSLDDIYGIVAFDIPITTISLTIDGKYKEIRHFHHGCGLYGQGEEDAPEFICNLESRIDQLANTAPLVAGQKEGS